MNLKDIELNNEYFEYIGFPKAFSKPSLWTKGLWDQFIVAMYNHGGYLKGDEDPNSVAYIFHEYKSRGYVDCSIREAQYNKAWRNLGQFYIASMTKEFLDTAPACFFYIASRMMMASENREAYASWQNTLEHNLIESSIEEQEVFKLIVEFESELTFSQLIKKIRLARVDSSTLETITNLKGNFQGSGEELLNLASSVLS